MLSVEDRAAIMVGLEAGLSQVRIARSIGRSPSVVCREIARHRGPGGVYKTQDAGRAAQVARHRPKKRLLDRDEVLRRRVIADLSQGRTHRQRLPQPHQLPAPNAPHRRRPRRLHPHSTLKSRQSDVSG